MRYRLALLLITLCITLVFAKNTGAYAQTLTPVLTEAPKPLGDIRAFKREPNQDSLKIVSERQVPELKAIPFKSHGFLLFPKVQTSQRVSTNIFATEQNEEADTVTSIEPSLFILKNYNRHQFNLLLNARADKYWSNSNEDQFNFNTKFGGALEATRSVTFPFEMSYVSGHKKRSQNFSNNFTVKPTAFNSLNTAAGITYAPNRLNLSLIGRYSDISFDNGENRFGQTIIKNDGDLSNASIELNGSYNVLPNHQPYASLTIGKTDYKRRNFQNGSYSGVDRSSDNLSFLAGWALKYKGLMEGNLGVGFGTREYDAPQLESINALKLSGNINWNLTPKSTLTVSLKQAISEDNDVVQGLILSQQRAQIDHELLHNFYVKAYAEKALLDYEQSNREDDIYSLSTGFRYAVSPVWSFSGDYTYQTRSSNRAGLDYDQNEFMLRVKKHF